VPWPTWEQAAIAALLSVVGWLVVGRLPRSRVGDALLPAFREFALVAGLYAVWRLARMLPITHEAGAIDRARDIDRLQHALHLPTEISVQHFVIAHDWLARFVNGYYAIVHVPALIAFMVWAFVRHRDLYPHWRNGLVAVTAGCLRARGVRGRRHGRVRPVRGDAVDPRRVGGRRGPRDVRDDPQPCALDRPDAPAGHGVRGGGDGPSLVARRRRRAAASAGRA
jgi:hypothetical protein